MVFLDESVDDLCRSYRASSWAQLADATLPQSMQLTQLANFNDSFRTNDNNNCCKQQRLNIFEESAEIVRARRLSARLVLINLVSLIVNLALASTAFYFAFTRDNSSATLAFAADCALDAISSAIVLWRFHGNLSSVYMYAREQIACIYLGALFEISALGISIEAIGALLEGYQPSQAAIGFHRANGKNAQAAAATTTAIATATNTTTTLLPHDKNLALVYLALVASIAIGVLTILKAMLFKSLRDNSILLDVINSLISTVFAVSIIASQTLININHNFWYLDPTLSMILAVFMALFGFKVIHENFNILMPTSNDDSCYNGSGSAAPVSRHIFDSITITMPPTTPNNGRQQQDNDTRNVRDTTSLISFTKDSYKLQNYLSIQ